MAHIAILVFGSLIEDPCKDLLPHIRERVDGIKTPFSIKSAGSSRSCEGGPTVAPVDEGGSPVNTVLLALDSAIGLAEAMGHLRRRETRNESSGKRHVRRTSPVMTTFLSNVLRAFTVSMSSSTRRFSPTSKW